MLGTGSAPSKSKTRKTITFQLELTIEEGQHLKEEVTKCLNQLDHEIAHTDSTDFKDMLKCRRDSLRTFLEKLTVVASVEEAVRYLKHFAALCGRHFEQFSKEAAAALCAYSWPGNVRELRTAVERAVILAKGSQINLEDLSVELRGHTVSAGNGSDPALQIGSLVSMEQLEEAHLRKVLQRTSNLAEAAQVLGIDQATLYRKRKKIGLE